jgi:hypothetical protein
MTEEELMAALFWAYSQDGNNPEDIIDLHRLMQDYMLDDEQYTRCLRFFEWAAALAAKVSGK